MKKRMISLLLIAVMLLSMFPVLSAGAADLSWDTQAAQPENGSGTAEDPYQITSGAELAWFAQKVGETRDADAVLTKDIDLSGFAWTPIGTAFQGYQGTFDGQGHTIRGLAVSGMEYAGLFACVDGGTVKRVIVSGSVSGTSVAGGIAAQIKNGASVLECGSEAQIQCSGGNCGGIVGCAGPNDGKNTIERCYNAGTVTCEKKSNDRAGGILGYDQGKAAITDCYNTGTINGGTYAGGIRGYLSTMAGKITNCYNAGQISAATTGTIAPSGKYDGENCYGLKNGDIVKDTLSEGETAQALSQAELLAALNGETGSSWKRDLTVNSGYPIFSWQSVEVPEGKLGQAENVAFEREIVDTLDGEENSLPTATLTWDAVKNATGYVAALWQKTRVWRELSAEEKAAYAQPLQEGETYSKRLLAVDQDVILAEFTTPQLQALYALQTKMDQAQDTLTQAVDARNSASEDEYEAANTAYKNALSAYETAYQACCEYIIKQAVENDLPLGDYWSETKLSAAVKLGTQTSYDFTKEFSKLDDGVYYATVSAIDDNGGYTIPTVEEVNETVVGWQDPYTRMKPITNLSWDGTIAKWDPKDYFTDDQVYRIDLYVVESTGYTFYKTFQVAASAHMADFKDAFSALRSYVFTVTAIADGDLETKYGVSDGIVSAFSPVYRPEGAPEIKEWVDITSAAQWMEIANTKDEKVDPSDPDSKNKQEIAWSKNYRLANDIDFSQLPAADQNRTKSIGNVNFRFQGEFDGQGHEIKGLTLSNYDSGLFWYVGSLGYIHDVKIVNPNVQFSDNAAVLVHNNYGIIEKCAIINCNINADIGAAIGGMVSRNYGIVRDSYVQGGQLNSHSTTATSHAGFVGTQEKGGLIERCWTSMDITTESDYAGGFAGQNYGGTIRDCFALGNVSARNCSGGFVGRTTGEDVVYENCYAAGVVKCTGYDGHGFIGGNLSWSGFQYDQSIGISNCYYNQASEEAATNYNAIGMTLDAMKSSTFCNRLGSRWERDDALNDGLPYLTGVKVPTKTKTDEIFVTIELIRYNKETYRFEKFGDEIYVEMASSGNTRVMDLMDAAQDQGLLTYGYQKTSYGRYVSKINGHEVLAPDGWMFTINDHLSNVGISLATVKQGDRVVWFEGTTQNHFQPPRADELDPDSGYWTKISSAEELVQLASASDEEAMAGHYILTKDIDLKDVAFSGIGSERAPFTGTFDGDGHTISNLNVSLDGEDNVGMFRVIKGATIKNLRLDNVTVSGSKRVGAVAGWSQVKLDTQEMDGSIAGLVGNVQVTGSVTGSEQTGGVIGLNDGDYDEDSGFSTASSVDRCSFEGEVNGVTKTGGLAGQNEGTITSSSAKGTVDAGETGTTAGGLVGESYGDIYDSFADVKVTAHGTVGGFVGSSGGTITRCYSLGDVYGADYVGGFAGRINAVDTAVSAGKVRISGKQEQGYVGGFAGNLGGTIVSATAYITVKNIYGNCMTDGSPLPAAGRTESQTSDGLTAALANMQLTSASAVKQKLKELFDVDFDRFDGEIEDQREQAKVVEKLIKALPAANKVKLTDREEIQAAQAAFDALSEDGKILVSDAMKEKLTACVEALETLIKENEAAVSAADAVTALLKKLPADSSKITALDVEAIKAARTAYDNLNKDELKLLDKADVKQLTACEKTLSKNQKAADKVQALIDKLPEADAVREELSLSDSKAVSAADKAFDKLTEDQKTFLKEGSEEKLTANVDRMAVLTENQADIKNAEKLIKSLPTAEKIKASDRTKLENAKAAYQKVTDSDENLTIDPDLAEKLEASKLAFETYEQDAQTFREEQLGQLPEDAAEVFASDEEAIINARAQYKLLSKNVQSFIEKDELSHLTDCEKTLKKNKSAAAKVDKLILKLPEDAGTDVTAKIEKAFAAAEKAYQALTNAQKSFVVNTERLDAWREALA